MSIGYGWKSQQKNNNHVVCHVFGNHDYHMGIFDGYTVEFSNMMDMWFYRICINIFRSFGSLALGYFFMISSFLLYRNLSRGTLEKKAFGRLKSLGIPFLIWNALAILFYWLKDGVLPFGSVREFLLAISVVPANGPLWYVFVLLIFLGLMPLGLVVREMSPKKQYVLLGIITLMSMCASLIYNHLNIEWIRSLFWVERITRYLPAYTLGILVASNGGSGIQTTQRMSTIARCFFALVLVYIVIFGADDGTTVINYLVMRCYPIVFWYSWYGRNEKPVKHLLLKASFLYYASHEPLIITLQWVLFKLRLSEMIWTGMQIIGLRVCSLLFIIGVLMAAVVVIYRIKPNCLNFLVGGRLNQQYSLSVY